MSQLLADAQEAQRLDMILATATDAELRHAFKEAMVPRDEAFDDLYLDGIFKDTLMPVALLKRRDRFRHLYMLLASTAAVPGAVAECGCWLGLSSYLLCHQLRREDADFRGQGYEIYDSFQGLSEPSVRDAAADPWFAGRSLRGLFVGPLDAVQQRLAEFPAITYVPGWIPSRFDLANTRQYRFVHVDVDLYDPTLAAFRYFWPRLAAGGLLVCDDYGGVRPAQQAVRDFCVEEALKVAISPFGQACFLKERA